MKVTALIKTFTGEEFCIESLESIYSEMHKIIYVHSNIGWDGSKGNTVKSKIIKWKKLYDKEKKIVNLTLNTSSQTEQYEKLYNYKVDTDYYLLVDTDEIWDKNILINAISLIGEYKNRGTQSFACNMKSYIKSPLFRVKGYDKLSPVAFVKSGSEYKGVRANGVYPRVHLKDIYFHHFCSVRKSYTDVWGKHTRSNGIENEPTVDKAKWKKNIWNRLPEAKNVLPLSKFTSHWAEVEKITINDLPEVMRNNELVKAFDKYIYKKPIDKTALTNMVSGNSEINKLRDRIPPDFGPSHPKWNTPSARARYFRLMMLLENESEVKKKSA